MTTQSNSSTKLTPLKILYQKPNKKWVVEEVNFVNPEDIEWVTDPQTKYYCAENNTKKILRGLKFTKYKRDANIEIRNYTESIRLYKVEITDNFLKKYDIDKHDDVIYTLDIKNSNTNWNTETHIQMVSPDNARLMNIKTAYYIAHEKDQKLSNDEFMSTLESLVQSQKNSNSEVYDMMKMILLSSWLSRDQIIITQVYLMYSSWYDYDLINLEKINCKYIGQEKLISSIEDEKLREIAEKVWNGMITI